MTQGDKRVPFNTSFDDYGNAYPVDEHKCSTGSKSADDVDTNYVYPTDVFKTLVRLNRGSGWQYLGTIVRGMSQRRQDKQMMSKGNFRKRWGNQ